MPPAETTGSRSAKDGSKRSSIRQSLSFMTVGKAFADVINTDKDSAKAKSLKRANTVSTKASAPRASLGDLQSTKRVASPDSGTATHRRRMSAIAPRQRQGMDDFGVKECEEPVSTITRSSTVRARPNIAGSALPKYRPKSIRVDPKKSSPLRAGARRRLPNSEDEKEGEQLKVSRDDKISRPISPLPQRAISKSKPSRGIDSPTPDLSKGTPRLAKVHKSSASRGTPVSRPGSTASSSSSPPSTPSRKGTAERTANKSSPLRSSGYPSSKKVRKPLLSPTESPGDGNISRISEGDSEELDKANVALLLGPTSSLARPTPAMPRLAPSNSRENPSPQTPSRGVKRKGQSKAPVIVPLPSDNSPRRPLKSSTVNAPRGSILSWEEMAKEASRTLGEDEIGAMLAEVNAPFLSRTGSPSLTYASAVMPDSPELSHFGSPAAFGPISSVLLPDITPSPAPHSRSQHLDVAVSKGGNSAEATFLRLQLVSMEQTSKERLGRIQTLEKELSELKKAQIRETEQLNAQVGQLEQQIRGKLQTSQRLDEEHVVRISDLQEQLQRAEVAQNQVVSHAVEQTRQACQDSHARSLSAMTTSWRKFQLSEAAATSWSMAQTTCHREMQLLRSDRQVIEVLLPELEYLNSQMLSELASCSH